MSESRRLNIFPLSLGVEPAVRRYIRQIPNHLTNT